MGKGEKMFMFIFIWEMIVLVGWWRLDGGGMEKGRRVAVVYF